MQACTTTCVTHGSFNWLIPLDLSARWVLLASLGSDSVSAAACICWVLWVLEEKVTGIKALSLELLVCWELTGPVAGVDRELSTNSDDEQQANELLMCVFGKVYFGGNWAVVDMLLVTTFNFGGFGVRVTESLRSSSSVFLKMSITYQCSFSVSSTSGGFYLRLGCHRGHRVHDYYQLRWELTLRVWGFSILFFSCGRWDFFLNLPIFLLLEQARQSAGGIGFGPTIASGSLSDFSCHFEGNRWGVSLNERIETWIYCY